MTQFSVNPNGVYLVPDSTGFYKDNVEPGFYNVAWDDQRKAFYLAYASPFEINHKVYGNSLQYADRILETFHRRAGKNTTAAFEGLKGSGKTLLAKQICIDFVNAGGIVITCNSHFCGDAFNKFIQDISQSKIVFFDEFEKTYADREHRDSILTLFDGTWQSHTLYLLTTNTDMYTNSNLTYFSNRPGRVYFNIKFKAVDPEAIKEYCQDNLENFDIRYPEIMIFIKGFRAFNMDMLSVLVTELNLNPDLTVTDLSEFLNIKPDADVSDRVITYRLIEDGNDITHLVDSFPGPYHIKEFFEGSSNTLHVYTGDGSDTPSTSLERLLGESSTGKEYTFPPSSIIRQDPNGVINIIDPEDPDVILQVISNSPQPRQRIIF